MLKNPEFDSQELLQWPLQSALVQSYDLTFRYGWSVTKGKLYKHSALCLHTVKSDTVQMMAFHLQHQPTGRLQYWCYATEHSSPEDDHLGTNKD